MGHTLEALAPPASLAFVKSRVRPLLLLLPTCLLLAPAAGHSLLMV